MNSLEFTLSLLFVSVLAGFLGSLTGLGGGVVMTPALTLLFGVDLRYAIGASLLSAIATSSGAASAYVREGYSNIRIGMFLEIATVFGALTGAMAASWIPTSALGVILGLVLLQSAWLSSRSRELTPEPSDSDPLAVRLRLEGRYPSGGGWQSYHVQRVKTGLGLMFGAGAISGLLGIGSGSLKVIAMDRAMRIPFKVSTTTSNFMIGVTAAASAGVYLNRARPGRRQHAHLAPGLRRGDRRLGDRNDCHRTAGAAVTDQQMDRRIGTLLRGGVLISAFTTAIGGIWHLAQFGGALPQDAVFHGEPAELSSVGGVLRGVAAGHSASLIQLGLLLMIATPIVRVAYSVYAFAAQRDRTYVAITLIVLAALAASLAGLQL
jgi:uncharacterized membrane protein YfcA/uncharacterized membrane protein